MVLHITYRIDTSRPQCIKSDLANVCHIWLDYRFVSFPSLPYAILKEHKTQCSVQHLAVTHEAYLKVSDDAGGVVYVPPHHASCYFGYHPHGHAWRNSSKSSKIHRHL